MAQDPENGDSRNIGFEPDEISMEMRKYFQTLASGLAHEISNPLTILRGYVGLLDKRLRTHELSPDHAQNLISGMYNSIDRMAETVASLKYFSRDMSEVNFEPIPLNTLLQSAFDLVKLKFDQYRVQFRPEMHCEPTIIGNRDLMVKVFHSLLSNGFDAVFRHSGERWVKVVSLRDAQDVLVKVVDSGDGVPEHQVRNLFLPFQNLKGRSPGMGLAITRGILEAHGGSIQYTPGEPHTTFEVRLPVKSP